MWELRDTKRDEIVAFLMSHDLGRILAVRLQMENFSIMPVHIFTTDELPEDAGP